MNIYVIERLGDDANLVTKTTYAYSISNNVELNLNINLEL